MTGQGWIKAFRMENWVGFVKSMLYHQLSYFQAKRLVPMRFIV